MVIDGRFSGSIHIDGHLHVREDGRVEAPASAKVVEVAGHLNGAVDAGDVLVRATGRLTGDVSSSSIGLDGGVLAGKVLMDVDFSDLE